MTIFDPLVLISYFLVISKDSATANLRIRHTVGRQNRRRYLRQMAYLVVDVGACVGAFTRRTGEDSPVLLLQVPHE